MGSDRGSDQVAQGVEVDLEQLLLLAPLVGLALSECDHLAQDLDVVAQRLGLGVAVLDVVGDAGEGNLGEFIKFVPGVTVNYSSRSRVPKSSMG